MALAHFRMLIHELLNEDPEHHVDPHVVPGHVVSIIILYSLSALD